MGERGVSIGNTIVTAAAQESRVGSMEEILENLARESVCPSFSMDRMTKLWSLAVLVRI